MSAITSSSTSLFRTSSARLVHQNLQREFDGMRAQEFHWKANASHGRNIKKIFFSNDLFYIPVGIYQKLYCGYLFWLQILCFMCFTCDKFCCPNTKSAMPFAIVISLSFCMNSLLVPMGNVWQSEAFSSSYFRPRMHTPSQCSPKEKSEK